jgi:hypothetical protein
MPGSGPKSIAVGLPGGVSYCFDAEACRIRYAWTGGFLDVAAVWSGRGGGLPRLAGKKFYTSPKLFPIRLADPSRDPSVKFLGYRIVDRLPQFRYLVDGVEVRELVRAAPGGIERAFEIDRPVADTWFLGGEVEGVAFSSDAGAWEGSTLKASASKFAVTVKVKE